MSQKEFSADIAIVGAGIVGLAHAYMAAQKGYQIVVFERDRVATGASIRNFGLLWPIGQAPGAGLDRALRSRQHWNEVAAKARVWLKPNGSLHLAYHGDEWRVLQEFVALYRAEPYQLELLSPERVMALSPGVLKKGLLGGLYSATEATVYSREAIRQIPEWLQASLGVQFRFGQPVTSVEMPWIKTPRERWRVGKVLVCSGNDFETLYPEQYEQLGLTRCKLHMMKATAAAPFPLGPSLCAGLTLRHYDAFQKCSSLAQVASRYDADMPAYHENGIHVLVSQNSLDEFIIGDSHHYGLSHEPFDSEHINQLIWQYLSGFFSTGALSITERWHGIYPKYKAGLHVSTIPEKDVLIINGLGGAGMTLSFGLAEEVINSL
ncbi:MAG: TIGR03364 family FAD-dependent oxidoreductase [Bacteroidota bacterium]